MAISDLEVSSKWDQREEYRLMISAREVRSAVPTGDNVKDLKNMWIERGSWPDLASQSLARVIRLLLRVYFEKRTTMEDQRMGVDQATAPQSLQTAPRMNCWSFLDSQWGVDKYGRVKLNIELMISGGSFMMGLWRRLTSLICRSTTGKWVIFESLLSCLS